MAETITNLKVRFGADTKQFKKGMNEGKKATKQFKRDAGSAIDDFAAAFGVNMNGIRSGIGKMNNALFGLSAGFKNAAAGSNVFTKALKILKAALISTGIGALVVALGSLIAYFTKTQRGADKVSQVFKGVGAVVDVFVDRLSGLGEKLVAVFRDPEQAIKDLWELIKENIVNRFEALVGLFETVGNGLQALWKRDMEGLKQAALDAGQAMFQLTTGLDEKQTQKLGNSIKGLTNEIKEEAAAAADLEKRRQALERQEIEFIKTKARLRNEISELILTTRDENIEGEKRLKNIKEAQKLQKQLSETEAAIADERFEILRQQKALGENMIEDDRELAEAEVALNEVRREGNDKLRELVNRYNEMTNKIKAQTKAIAAEREELTKNVSTPMESIGLSVDMEMPDLETDKLLAGLKTNLEEAKNVVVDFADLFNSTFSDLAVSFGENLGNIISGAGGFKDFGNVILGSLGDLAIKVGKMAIGTGVAIKGIKKALQSLNPAVAIAGGIALVALGTAIKGALSGAASGGGTTEGTFSNQVYDNTSVTPGRNSEVQGRAEAITVNVNGTFTQRGTDMVSVINETQKRSKYNG